MMTLSGHAVFSEIAAPKLAVEPARECIRNTGTRGGLQGAVAKSIELRPEDIIKHLRMTGAFDLALHCVVKERKAEELARNFGIIATDEEIQRAADDFRRVRKLDRASVFLGWLDASQLSLDEFERKLECMILLSKLREAGEGLSCENFE